MKKGVKHILALLLAVMMVLSVVPAAGLNEAYALGDDGLSGTSGYCNWQMTPYNDKLYTFTVTGSGNMQDYNLSSHAQYTNAQWSPFVIAGKIYNVRTQNNVRSISAYGFARPSNTNDGRGIREVILSDSVRTIGNSAFFAQSDLWLFKPGAQLERIEDYAFMQCAITTLDLQGTNINYIGGHAFAENSIYDLNLPAGTEVGRAAFIDCKKMESMSWGRVVDTIEASTFQGCSSLRSIVIPDDVTTIKDKAFWFCSDLTDVYYGGTQAQWNAINIGTENNPIKKANIRYNCKLSGNAIIDSQAVTGQTVYVSFPSGTNQYPRQVMQYEWYRNGTLIEGANQWKYKVTADDIGCNLTVHVKSHALDGVMLSNTCRVGEGIPLTPEYFPDSVLRSYLKTNYDKDSNEFLNSNELYNATTISLGGTNLKSLDGIQYLNQLRYLYVYRTKLTSFDGTGVTNLQVLDLSDNAINSLNVTDNIYLEELYLEDCTGTLRNPDLSGNPDLRILATYRSGISIIDISACPDLVDAALRGEIKELTYADGREYATVHQISNNCYFTNDGYDHNVTVAHFSEAFPCEKVRSILQNNNNINWYPVGGTPDDDLSISEAKEVINLDFGDEEELVTSLKGIEFFPNLEWLAAFNCQISSVDLSKNTKLYYVDLDTNKLEYLDLSNNPELETVWCARNNLSELILGSNLKLTNLQAWDNDLTEVDLSGCPNLQEVNLDMNDLWIIDTEHNPVLKKLVVSNNKLDVMFISNNPGLNYLSCYGNKLDSVHIEGLMNLCSAYKETPTSITDSDTGCVFLRYNNDAGTLCVDPGNKVWAYEDMYYATFNGASLSLKDKISVNVYLKVPDGNEDFTANVYYEKDGFKTLKYQYPLTKSAGYYSKSDDKYKISFPDISAKEMTEKVRVVVVDNMYEEPLPILKDGRYEPSIDYCAADWANTVISSGMEPRITQLAKALLNFGGAAQRYWEYNMRRIATPPSGFNADMSAVTAKDLEAFKPEIINGSASDVGYSGMSLSLKSETYINDYFTKNVSVVSVSNLGKAKYAVKKSGDSWKVKITGIAAKNLGSMYTLKLNAEGKTVDQRISALSWAYIVLSNNLSKEVTLAKALYLYYKAAAEYFAK